MFLSSKKGCTISRVYFLPFCGTKQQFCPKRKRKSYRLKIPRLPVGLNSSKNYILSFPVSEAAKPCGGAFASKDVGSNPRSRTGNRRHAAENLIARHRHHRYGRRWLASGNFKHRIIYWDYWEANIMQNQPFLNLHVKYGV